MKHVITVIILFSCCVLACSFISCSDKKIYSGIPVGRVSFIVDDTLRQFYTRQVGYKINPLIHQNYAWFKPDTIIFTEGAYAGKLLNGEYKELYPGGALKTRGTFNDGVKSGQWKEWFPGGILRTVYQFANGKKNGNFTEYSPAGQAIYYGEYEQDHVKKSFQLQDDGSIRQKIFKNDMIQLDTMFRK